MSLAEALADLSRLVTAAEVKDDEEVFNAAEAVARHPRGRVGLRRLLCSGAISSQGRRAILFGLASPPVAQADVALLRAALQDSDPYVVAEAIDALVEAGDDRDLPLVLAMSDAPSPYVRGAVLRFAAGRRLPSARDRLVAALSDPHPIVRQNAIDELDVSLGDGDPDRSRLLSALLQDPDDDVRAAARSALTNCG